MDSMHQLGRDIVSKYGLKSKELQDVAVGDANLIWKCGTFMTIVIPQ